MYFGTGANLLTNPASAIFHAYLAAAEVGDEVNNPSGSIVFPDGAGPIGAVGEIVSMRTSEDVSTGSTFTIVYREV